MPASPCDQPRHVVVGDSGQQLVLAEELDQERKLMLGVVGACMVLPGLLPIPIGDVVEAQRGLRRRELAHQLDRLLTLGRLYFFGFAARRAFRRAVKPMTSHLEVEVEIRRPTVSVLVDGHGESFRVWLAIKSLISAAVNILRGRFAPLPMLT